MIGHLHLLLLKSTMTKDKIKQLLRNALYLLILLVKNNQTHEDVSSYKYASFFIRFIVSELHFPFEVMAGMFWTFQNI